MRRTHGYTLYLDRAGLCTSDPLTDEVGACETWEQLHWMAKGAEPFERGGRLWARDESNGTVLCMADMRLEHEPGLPDGFTRCPKCHGKTCVLVDGVCWECMKAKRGYDLPDTTAVVAAVTRAMEDESLVDPPPPAPTCDECGEPVTTCDARWRYAANPCPGMERRGRRAVEGDDDEQFGVYVAGTLDKNFPIEGEARTHAEERLREGKVEVAIYNAAGELVASWDCLCNGAEDARASGSVCPGCDS